MRGPGCLRQVRSETVLSVSNIAFPPLIIYLFATSEGNGMIEQSTNELIWFLFGLALMLMELVLPGFIVVFFGAGAWIVALLVWSGLPISFSTQLVIFLAASLVLLFLFRKYGKDYFKGKVTKENIESFDSVRGERVTVVSEIHPATGGKVEFNGTIWNAESSEVLAKGTAAEIVERKNLILTVQSIKK